MNKALILIAIGSLLACSPKVVKREYSVPKMNFNTATQDPDLVWSKQAQGLGSKISWNGEINSADYLNTAESLIRLGRKYNRSKLELQGERLAQLFYKTPGAVTKPSFVETLFASTAINLSTGDLVKELDKAETMIAKNIKILVDTIEGSKTKFPWPKSDGTERRSIPEIKTIATNYVAWVLQELRNQMDPEFFVEVNEQVNKLVAPELALYFPLIDKVSVQTQLRPLLASTKHLLSELGVKLEAAEQAQMAEADRLGVLIENIRDAQDVATAMVAIWQSKTLFSTQAEKIAVFSEIDKTIAEDLAALDEGELKCLGDRDCDALINTNLDKMKIAIGKKVKIFPMINKFTDKNGKIAGEGPSVIQALMNDGACKYLFKVIELKGTGVISQLPRVAQDKIRESHALEKPYETIRPIQADVKGFIRNLVNKFAAEKFNGEAVPGVESSRINITWLAGRSPKLKGVKANGGMPSGASAIGASFVLANLRLEKQNKADASQKPQVMRNMLSQMNKLMAISGFEEAKGKKFRSYTVSQAPNTTSFKHFDLENDASSKIIFAIPDRFSVVGNYNGVQMTKGRAISIAGQAETLRGLSSMINYFQDWKTNGFDHSLGQIKLGELLGDGLPGAKPGAVDNDPNSITNKKLFEKSLMFTLAVGNAANILQNFERELSPFYMTNPKAKDVLWLNKFKETPDTDTIITGGVDIVNGKRQDITRPADVARLLLAVTDFIDATEGLDNTKSKELLCLDKDGRMKKSCHIQRPGQANPCLNSDGYKKPGCDTRPVDLLREARTKLQSMIMTTANFLSGMMIHEPGTDNAGLAYAEFNVVSREKYGTARAADQAVIIRALLAAARIKQVRAYVTAAVEMYYAMNRQMFNPDTGFYNTAVDSKKLPNPHDMLTIIESLDEIKETLDDEKSLAQLEKIMNPWLGAFEVMK
jgi:hypothetical protein